MCVCVCVWVCGVGVGFVKKVISGMDIHKE